MAILEIACFSLTSALAAVDAGADRIELCANQSVGGTTPPHEWLPQLRQHTRIPIYAMIRPRGGNFEYTPSELAEMYYSIEQLTPFVDGFVFGVLNGEAVDVPRTADLVARAHPLPCTFHRAIDETHDLVAALEDVVSAGCRAILSSGGAACAVDGMATLAALVERSAGRVTIIPGGGVRHEHLVRLQRETRAVVYHSSALLGETEVPDAEEIRLMLRCLVDDVG